MWRRLLYSNLKTLTATSTSTAAPTTIAARFLSTTNRSFVNPSSSRCSSVIARYYSTDSAATVVATKRVEDVVPIATGHEREELEAELQGKDILEINHPIGPSGPKMKRVKGLCMLNKVLRLNSTQPAQPARLIGFDFGKGVTGVAFSDPTTTMGLPLTVVDMKKPITEQALMLKDIITRRHICGAVIGYAAVDGCVSPMGEEAINWMNQLDATGILGDLEYVVGDEFETTKRAKREVPYKSVREFLRKPGVQMASAAFMLERVLKNIWIDRENQV